MMEYVAAAITSLLASGLTFFSGFGLGTLLMPVLVCFFPVSVAVTLTAIIHFLNNLFKFYLTGKHANKKIILHFGIPAVCAAAIGATLLFRLTTHPILIHYRVSGYSISVEIVKLVMAVLIILFAATGLSPTLEKMIRPSQSPLWGGLLSGFFGGLSGHQGAFRSAVLIQYGLSKESFIATNVVIACMVDFVRLTVYSSHFTSAKLDLHAPLLLTATGFAFLGSWLGNRFLKKITLRIVQYFVAGFLFLIAAGLASGLI